MEASDKAVDAIQNNLPQSLLTCITESQENLNHLPGLRERFVSEFFRPSNTIGANNQKIPKKTQIPGKKQVDGEDEVLPRDTALVSTVHPMVDTKPLGSDKEVIDEKEVAIDKEVAVDKEGVSNVMPNLVPLSELDRLTEIAEALFSCTEFMDPIMSEFFPSSDPMVDTKRLALESSHGKISPVIETLRRNLNIGKDVDSDGKYRSAKNMVLAVKVILEGKQPEFIADYMAAIKAKKHFPPQKEPLFALQSMTRNTFKNYIEYAGTERFTRNIEFWQDLLKRRREVLNQEEHMKAGAKELEEAPNNR